MDRLNPGPVRADAVVGVVGPGGRMRLRYHRLSPHGQKVRAILDLRGDRYQAHVVDEGEPDRDPILETTSGIYVGTADILNYLEGIEPVLRPEGVRARVDDLDRMLELYLIEPCLTMDAWPGTIAAHKAWHTAARAVAMVEDRLERSHFLVGDGLTVADVTGVIGLALAEEQGIPIPGRCRAWQDRLTQVPALAEARSPGASWGRTRRAA